MKSRLSTFIQNTSIDAKLVRSVVRQLGGYETFSSCAKDVTNYGADGGFIGFTYHADTVEFTKRNLAAILALCRQQAVDYGMSGSIVEFVAGFNCLKGESMHDVERGLYYVNSDMRPMVYNALAWYALEEVCRAYCDFLEQ